MYGIIWEDDYCIECKRPLEWDQKDICLSCLIDDNRKRKLTLKEKEHLKSKGVEIVMFKLFNRR